MSLIDHVLKPSGLSWLYKKVPADVTHETTVPRTPSLASVEYELSQLRSSLDGVVDFSSPHHNSRLATKGAAVVLSTGLQRSETHRQKLLDAAV